MAVEGGATSPGPREKLDAQIKSADMVRAPRAGKQLSIWAEVSGNRQTTCSRRPSTLVSRPSPGWEHTLGGTDADDRSSSRGNGEVHDREGTDTPSHALLGSRYPWLYRTAMDPTRFYLEVAYPWSLTHWMAGHCPTHQENI